MTRHEEQRKRILDAGLRLWPEVSSRRIGIVIGMSHSNVLYYFGSSADLRNAIAEYAVASRDGRVIRYLIAEKHAAVSSVSELDRMIYMAG